MGGLADLPSELLHIIFVYLKHIDLESGILARVHYRSDWNYNKLALISRKISDVVVSILWADIHITELNSFVKLHGCLQLNPSLSNLARHFYFDIRSTDESVKKPWQPGVTSRAGRCRLAVMTRDVVLCLTQLKTLRLNQEFYTKGQSTWQLDLKSKSLTRVEMEMAHLYPVSISSLLKLDTEHLALTSARFTRNGWKTAKLDVRSQIPRLTLHFHQEFERIFRHDRVMKSILSCFVALKHLDLWLASPNGNETSLQMTLDQLRAKDRIETLKLRTCLGMEFVDGQYLNCCNWRCLKVLDIESIALWPINESWSHRETLAQQLPSSLKSLHVR